MRLLIIVSMLSLLPACASIRSTNRQPANADANLITVSPNGQTVTIPRELLEHDFDTYLQCMKAAGPHEAEDPATVRICLMAQQKKNNGETINPCDSLHPPEYCNK